MIAKDAYKSARLTSNKDKTNRSAKMFALICLTILIASNTVYGDLKNCDSNTADSIVNIKEFSVTRNDQTQQVDMGGKMAIEEDILPEDLISLTIIRKMTLPFGYKKDVKIPCVKGVGSCTKTLKEWMDYTGERGSTFFSDLGLPNKPFIPAGDYKYKAAGMQLSKNDFNPLYRSAINVSNQLMARKNHS